MPQGVETVPGAVGCWRGGVGLALRPMWGKWVLLAEGAGDMAGSVTCMVCGKRVKLDHGGRVVRHRVKVWNHAGEMVSINCSWSRTRVTRARG